MKVQLLIVDRGEKGRMSRVPLYDVRLRFGNETVLEAVGVSDAIVRPLIGLFESAGVKVKRIVAGVIEGKS